MESSIFFDLWQQRFCLDDKDQTPLHCGNNLEVLSPDGFLNEWASGRVEMENGKYVLRTSGASYPLIEGMTVRIPDQKE